MLDYWRLYITADPEIRPSSSVELCNLYDNCEKSNKLGHENQCIKLLQSYRTAPAVRQSLCYPCTAPPVQWHWPLLCCFGWLWGEKGLLGPGKYNIVPAVPKNRDANSTESLALVPIRELLFVVFQFAQEADLGWCHKLLCFEFSWFWLIPQ